jgi:hypothetical protein
MEDFQNMWDGGAKDKKLGAPKFILIHNPILKTKDQTKVQSRSKRNEAQVVFLGGGGESVGLFNGFQRRWWGDHIWQIWCVTHTFIFYGNALMLLAVAAVDVMLLWTLCNITQLACFFPP